MLVLNSGQAQAQTPGQIVKWFDDQGTLADSIITETIYGNIGIGTTTPRGKLEVSWSPGRPGRSFIFRDGLIVTDGGDSTVGGYATWPFQHQDANGRVPFGLNYDVDSGGFNVVIGAASGSWPDMGSAYKFTIKDNGNVGIGTTNPISKLHVAGRVFANGYDVPSDIRLKEDIETLTGALEKLDKLRGVSFKWNARAESLGQISGNREIGVIAQEVEAAFPEVVATVSKEGYKAVDYSRLTAVLIEAVKELKAENEALKSRFVALERK